MPKAGAAGGPPVPSLQGPGAGARGVEPAPLLLAALLAAGGLAVVAAWRRARPAASGQATFLGHVEELRRRLLAVAAVALGATVLALGVRLAPWKGVWVPVPTLYDNLAAQVYRAMAAHVVPPGVQLVAMGPTDAFAAQFAVGLGIGLAVALPVALYHGARFFGPALRPHERRLLGRAILPATLLFAAGAAFCYAWVLPFTLRALYGFNPVLGSEPLLRVGDLAALVVSFLVGFGLAFETPLVMVALARAGLVPAAAYTRHWRAAVVVVVVAAAVITPDPTVVSQLMLAVPVLLLYFAGAWLARRAAPAPS
jgi:sec-independent protein translocase protein TatC